MADPNAPTITWNCSVPIVPNPYVLRETLNIGVSVVAVFGVTFWAVGWLVAGSPVAEDAFLLAGVGGGGALAIAFLFFVAWVIAAGNHIPTEQTLTAEGAMQRRASRWYAAVPSEIASWWTVRDCLGARQTYGGIGAEDTDGVSWANVRRVRADRARRVIELQKGRFRTVRLYCPEESVRFQEILDLVEARVAAARAGG